MLSTSQTNARVRENAVLVSEILRDFGWWEALTEEDQEWLFALSNEMRMMIGRGDVEGAVGHMNEQNLTLEQRLGLWSRFDSKERAAMKKKRPV